MRLVEKYRPKRFADLVGQDKAITQLRTLISRGIGGRALLLEGPSGVGKTAAALALAREIGIVKDDETLQRLQSGSNMDLRFYQSRNVDVHTVAELGDWLQRSCWQSPFKMALIDEAQAMSAKGTEGMLTLLEGLLEHNIVVMTTTQYDDELFRVDGPFASRCQQVFFQRLEDTAIAERLAEIAFAESGNGVKVAYREIVRRGNGNMRTCLQLLETALGQL